MNTHAKAVTTTEYFGGCPECGKADGYLNLGAEHWFICAEHKTRCRIGINLLSGWREESEAHHLENGAILDGYREVKPVLPPPEWYAELIASGDTLGRPRCSIDRVNDDLEIPF